MDAKKKICNSQSDVYHQWDLKMDKWWQIWGRSWSQPLGTRCGGGGFWWNISWFGCCLQLMKLVGKLKTSHRWSLPTNLCVYYHFLFQITVPSVECSLPKTCITQVINENLWPIYGGSQPKFAPQVAGNQGKHMCQHKNNTYCWKIQREAGGRSQTATVICVCRAQNISKTHEQTKRRCWWSQNVYIRRKNAHRKSAWARRKIAFNSEIKHGPLLLLFRVLVCFFQIRHASRMDFSTPPVNLSFQSCQRHSLCPRLESKRS